MRREESSNNEKRERDESFQKLKKLIFLYLDSFFQKKQKKTGTLSSRLAILHALCHIESWAIDLVSFLFLVGWGGVGGQKILKVERFSRRKNSKKTQISFFSPFKKKKKELGHHRPLRPRPFRLATPPQGLFRRFRPRRGRRGEALPGVERQARGPGVAVRRV